MTLELWMSNKIFDLLKRRRKKELVLLRQNLNKSLHRTVLFRHTKKNEKLKTQTNIEQILTAPINCLILCLTKYYSGKTNVRK